MLGIACLFDYHGSVSAPCIHENADALDVWDYLNCKLDQLSVQVLQNGGNASHIATRSGVALK
jgi:hypothetical protein